MCTVPVNAEEITPSDTVQVQQEDTPVENIEEAQVTELPPETHEERVTEVSSDPVSVVADPATAAEVTRTEPANSASSDVIDSRIAENAEAIAEHEVASIEQRQLVLDTIAKEESNEDTFVLLSTSTFAINEVPEFVFSLPEEKNFVEETITSVTDTVVELYSESVIETVVDAVISAVVDAVSYIIPEAEGQTVSEEVGAAGPETDEVSSPLVSVEEEVRIDVGEEPSLPHTTEPEGEGEVVPLGDGIDVVVVQEELVSPPTETATATTAATSTPAAAPSLPYALVDGILVPVTFAFSENVLTIRIEGVFGVGQHAGFIHILHDEREVVLPVLFTVSGTILLEQPLIDTYVAMVTSDAEGVRTLWLTDYASGTVRSFEKIVTGEYVGVVTTYGFENNTLIWDVATLSTVMGYDIVSKNLFSQTLHTAPRQKNIIELETGAVEVLSTAGVVNIVEADTQKP